MRGRVALYLDGRLICERDNLFLNAGAQALAQFLAGSAPAAPGYIALGNQTDPVVTAADTALEAEISRHALTSSGVLALYTVRFAAYWLPSEAQGTITEVGLFSAATNGTMYARAAVSCVKGAQPLNVVWQLQLPSS